MGFASLLSLRGFPRWCYRQRQLDPGARGRARCAELDTLFPPGANRNNAAISAIGRNMHWVPLARRQKSIARVEAHRCFVLGIDGSMAEGGRAGQISTNPLGRLPPTGSFGENFFRNFEPGVKTVARPSPEGETRGFAGNRLPGHRAASVLKPAQIAQFRCA